MNIVQGQFKVKRGGVLVDPTQVYVKRGGVLHPLWAGSGDNGLLNGLVSYWPLDEFSGFRVASHGPVIQLRENGAVGGAAGKIGNAAVMNQTAYLGTSVGQDVPLRITGELSISAWVNNASLPNDNRGIVSKWLGTGNQRAYSLIAGVNGFRFVVSTDGTSTGEGHAGLSDFTAISTSTWYHVCAVYEPSTAMRIYVNNVETALLTSGVPASIFSADSSLWIGQQFAVAPNLRFDGLIDEVGIWSRALSSADVAALYNGGLGLAYPNFTS